MKEGASSGSQSEQQQPQTTTSATTPAGGTAGDKSSAQGKKDTSKKDSTKKKNEKKSTSKSSSTVKAPRARPVFQSAIGAELRQQAALAKVSTEAERTKVMAGLGTVEEWLYEDGYNADIDTIISKMKEVEELIQPINQKAEDEARQRLSAVVDVNNKTIKNQSTTTTEEEEKMKTKQDEDNKNNKQEDSSSGGGGGTTIPAESAVKDEL
eukprot:GHVS01045388.1.p2 GENE.GHVS01045388.1~~GHVS01045388.1.p2  ORF type:complete len:210 (-),score=78.52 GHVS01045388.1:171-800(-)